MNDQTYDLITLGGGSGGVACSRRAAALGAKVLLIEEDRLGGTCVIRGCVPKKLMLFASQFGQTVRNGLQPGWTVEQANFDMDGWQDAKQAEIDRLEGIYARMLQNSGVETVSGRGEILSPTEVKVGDLIYRTRRILIATGGKPDQSAFTGLEQLPTSNELLDLRAVPSRTAVVGAGYIALEFACILHGLGSQVDVFYRGQLPLRGFDGDIQSRLAQSLVSQGIRLHPGTEFQACGQKSDGYFLQTGQGRFEFDFLLNATGRRPNSKRIGLEAVGVQTDSVGAIRVDEFSRTNVQGIFAIGDVTNRVCLTPVAIAEGRALAENEFNQGRRTVRHDLVPTATFTQPPIGQVGLTEEQAVQRGRLRIYETEFTPMKTLFAGGRQKMYMKLLVDDASDRVLGAHVLGEDAPEMIQLLGIAVSAGLTKTQFDQTVAVHPTSAEEWVLLREVSRTAG